MRYKHLSILILIAIFCLGFFLRVVNIENSPPSLNWDEAALGYNAFSILNTGKDEYGVAAPLFTRSFDDYKSALPIYPMILSVKTFGLNAFAVRFPTAVWGSLSIFLIYLIANKIFKKQFVAIISSFIFAIEPWSIHFSRVYHEATMANFFYLLMLYLLFASKKISKLLPLAVFAGIVSMFTYHTNKLLVPLTFISFLFLYKNEFSKFSLKVKQISGLLLFLGFGLFAHQAIYANALARVESTSVLRIFSENSNLFLNVPLLLQAICVRYMAYFFPPNIFLNMASEPATQVPGNSMFFPIDFLFWIIGLFFVLKNYQKNKVFLILIMLAPIPTSFTWNLFQPGRTLALFSFFSILIGVGIYKVWNKLKTLKLPFAIFAVVVYLMSIFYIFDSENYQISARNYGGWQPGFKESMPFVAQNEENYQSVIIDTPHAQPNIFVLFYSKYSPSRYLSELDLEKIGNPRKVYDFGKYTFKKVNFANEEKKKDTIYVLWRGSSAFGQFSDDELELKQEVKNIDDDTIVRVVAFKKNNEN